MMYNGIKCPYCGHIKDTFNFLRDLHYKDIKDINNDITCDKCGKVFNMYLGAKNKSNCKRIIDDI